MFIHMTLFTKPFEVFNIFIKRIKVFVVCLNKVFAFTDTTSWRASSKEFSSRTYSRVKGFPIFGSKRSFHNFFFMELIPLPSTLLPFFRPVPFAFNFPRPFGVKFCPKIVSFWIFEITCTPTAFWRAIFLFCIRPDWFRELSLAYRTSFHTFPL